MGQKIERDHQRFKKLVRGKVKSNLSKYISRGEMIGKKGKDLVSIPLPQIDAPQFRYGQKGSGGVGQGPGQVGQPLGPGKGEPGGGAGDQPGGHILEVELTMEEMAAILGEELALPRIEPRGKKNIVTTRDKYTGIRQTGPESLRHFKRTFKRALQPPDRRRRLRPRRADRHPGARGQAVSQLEGSAAAAERGRPHLHDGRVRLDDRRAEGDRPHRGVLDRRLDQGPLQGRRDGLHHPRRGGPGSGRTHLLPHARVGRHQDQLGLPPGGEDHQHPLPAGRRGTFTPSTSPTATTGATTRRTASNCCRRSCCPS